MFGIREKFILLPAYYEAHLQTLHGAQWFYRKEQAMIDVFDEDFCCWREIQTISTVVKYGVRSCSSTLLYA
jgi:hypothetical protein